MKKITSLLMVVSVALNGCATIMGDTKQNVTITSEPDKAAFTITDEKGVKIKSGNLPETISLDKSDGSYFGGKTYTVEISMDGYQTKQVIVNSKANGWFVGGNLIFGGLIGWLIVDPFTGAMYNLSPDQVNGDLEKSTRAPNLSLAGNSDSKNRSIHMVLYKDVPKALRSKMKKLN